MATRVPKHPPESAQEHIPMCEKHDLPIDITCEDCAKFICSKCAKTAHKDHYWNTIFTAGILQRRELKKTLSKVKGEDMKDIDEKIQMASKQIEDNQKCYDSEVSKLQKHFDEIVSKLNEIKKQIVKTLRENLEKINAQVNERKLILEKKRDQIDVLATFLEEKHKTMSDYSLIDNLKDLSYLKSNSDSNEEMGNQSVRYRRGEISEGLLETIMGQTFDLDDEINTSEIDSFQHGDRSISYLEAIDEDKCFMGNVTFGYIEKVSKKNETVRKINIDIGDVCVTDNGDVYFTVYKKFSIVRLSPSGSVSEVFSTAPLEPKGICQSTEGGLLVTLRDNESGLYQPDSQSKRLVRHVALTGDVIREYEYQEDGQTRLFTAPYRIKQNGNTDICVVNRTSISAGELVILSSSGISKFVYRGQRLMKKFNSTDVVCDLHCNCIVNDLFNSQVHLLSPNGKFVKYLLTENDVNYPWSMSLYKSTLWVGNIHGIIKVFHCN